MARPEELMQWIYSEKFSGGGPLLSILVISEGLYAIHAIFGSVLNAAGKFQKTAVITALSLIPLLPLVILFIHFGAEVGAALASILIPLCIVLIFSVLIWQQFGVLLPRQSMYRIGLAGTLMFLVDALLPRTGGIFILLHLVSVVTYVVFLTVLGELSRKDFALFLSQRQLRPESYS